MTSSSGIRHLRAQGAFLYKRSTPQHLTLVAVKGDVVEADYDRVTEAFGVENCPQLVHLLAEGDENLKQRVLTALATVFKLPQNLVMCLKYDVLKLIEDGIVGEHKGIRERSALVLSVIALSPCGRSAIMTGETVSRVKSVFAAAKNAKATIFLYDALLELCRSFTGSQLLSSQGYLQVVLDHLKRSLGEDLRLRSLQLLKCIMNDGIENTVFCALDLEAVDLSANHLYDDKATIRVASCDAIAAMCYVDKAKKTAVDKGVVKKICYLLTDTSWQVTAASAGALMCIAVNDEAKRVIVGSEALQCINQLLQSPKYLVQLNTVKLVAVMAAYPAARKLLDVPGTEYYLRSLMSDSDAVLSRSAKTALQVVQWRA